MRLAITSLLRGKLFCFLFFLITLLIPELGWCQIENIDFPTRAINYIIPLPPGGPTDMAARLIAKEAEKYFKQLIVPINKPGGAMAIGIAAVATSKPDGYTIGISLHGPLFVLPFLEKVPYHPINDLQQIMQFATFNHGVVVKYDSPFREFKDVIAYARQNPKKLTFGAATHGMPHFIMEQIAKKENVQFTHMPFRGTPEVEMALLGGHISMGAGDFNYSLVESGKTRPLLLLREEPSAEYPQTPILKDLGYDIPSPMLFGIEGPKGLPEGISKKIEEAFTNAMKEPAFIKGMKELRLPIVYRNGKELGDYVARNHEAYGKLIKGIGFSK